MSKRSNSGLAVETNTDPATAPLPVAQAVWSPSVGDVEAQVLTDPLLSSSSSPEQPASNKPSENNNLHVKKNDDKSFPQPSSFHVTNEQTNQYWGRFNDPQVSAVYADDTAGAGAGAGDYEPTATARPDDRAIRMGFIRKVYTILSVQLLLTFAICAVIELHGPTNQFVTGNMGLYWFNVIVCFGTLIPLHFYKRSYPTNFVLLGVFTVSMATMVGMITSMYAKAGAGDLVLEAVAITASVFIILTIYTLQSKYDFSFMGAGLGMCLWIMILWGFFSMIFGFQTGSVYALMGSILFSGYIIYDTYMIAERLDPEDYIVASIELYLDLVNLFLYILRLLSEMDRR